MIQASSRFLLFDYFRVPYTVKLDTREVFAALSAHGSPPSGGWICNGGNGSSSGLYWVADSVLRARLAGVAQLGAYSIGSVRLFGHVLPDRFARGWFRESNLDWEPAEPVLDEAGDRFASVWRAEDGSVFLPFDANEVISNFWSEGYLRLTASSASASVKRTARRAYYRLRPLLPRSAQLALRRGFTKIQARSRFPRWPVESSLHDLYTSLFGLVTAVTGEPVPRLSVWPKGHSWALVLTHDVETDRGWRHLEEVREAEVAAGYRSSWNLVPRRDYRVEDERVRELKDAGFEVGVHGLRHDGRDFASAKTLRARLPAMQEHARRWGAVGFRSPATHRVWEWMPQLGFDYDSSYSDTDPFEPQGGGCCTWLPYHNRDLIELPITLPQDSTVFQILQHEDASLWLEKAALLKERGGLALMLTHPDYMIEGPVFPAYMTFLETFADDASAWKALPSEVSSWWRRRAASRLTYDEGRWQIVGPAAEDGEVIFDTRSGAVW